MSGPASISIPTHHPDHGETLHGNDSHHFISRKEWDLWAKSHPSLRPPAATDKELEGKGYRAPQHPASHVLQSIPPRAPSRSSRSNILSYTLHLATSTRLTCYNSPNGTRSLLEFAEDSSAKSAIEIDENWLELEQKAQGMWKLGTSLLKAQRKESSALPASVERRVSLAELAEGLLSNPKPEQAIKKIHSNEIFSSEADEALKALRPLTSPDTTTLYLSTTTNIAPTRDGASFSSVAQSLIDKKFGQSKEEAKKEISHDAKIDRSAETVFAAGTPTGANTQTSSSHGVTATPHMDYRIVRGQAMRSRAKEIFSESILPANSHTWCRRHRVSSCTVCSLVAATKLDVKHRNIPGQGLDLGTTLVTGKRRLVELIPQFLDLSANLLRDARERASGDTDTEINVTAIWYNILCSLLTQSCLEGYLVDGWTETKAIEILFGCGCGVWEGRGWAKRAELGKLAEDRMEIDPSDSFAAADSDDSDSSQREEFEIERERDSARLVDAAQILFGSRDVAQADFERTMRDRIHEFLNVSDEKTLETHLISLNLKYPLSQFETEMVDFLQSTTNLLGKPALAKQYEQAIAAPNTAPPGEPDLWALTAYFARGEPKPQSTESQPSPHRAWEESTKKRRIE